jgi:hypothetical protein
VASVGLSHNILKNSAAPVHGAHPEAVLRIIPMFPFLAYCRRARFPGNLPAPGLTFER